MWTQYHESIGMTRVLCHVVTCHDQPPDISEIPHTFRSKRTTTPHLYKTRTYINIGIKNIPHPCV